MSVKYNKFFKFFFSVLFYFGDKRIFFSQLVCKYDLKDFFEENLEGTYNFQKNFHFFLNS